MTRRAQVTKVPWILGLGFRVDYIEVIMENQMEKKMGVLWGSCRGSIGVI